MGRTIRKMAILALVAAMLSTVPGPASGQPDGAANALDQPLQWLHEARNTHAQVRDYTCTFIKQERVHGRLLPQHVILMKFRTQPFSVNMRWAAPAEQRGQEVSYIHGRNRNKMRVKSTKPIQNVVGFVSLDVDDPRTLEQSRHTIRKAGIGNIIEETIGLLEIERQVNRTQVRLAEYAYNNQPCHRIELIRTVRHPDFYCYRTVLYLDKQNKLPVRMENYDWPAAGQSPDGELIESFSFVNVTFNVGLSDADFER